MSKSLITLVTLLMFINLMMSIGHVSADRLIHDLQHDHHVEHVEASHHPASPLHKGADNDLAILEHQMLHAIDQLQFFANLSVVIDITPSLFSFPPLQPNVQSTPLSTFDPPFRPPRNSAFPA